MPRDIITRASPNTINELAGNPSLIAKLKNSIENDNKSILISGPVGCGKTKCIELILKETGIEGIWFDSSELKDNIDKICSKSSSISGQKKVFIIDNVDTFPSEISKLLVKKIKEAENIIIIVCNDLYPIKDFQWCCEVFKFIRPSAVQIKNFLYLKKIFKKEKLSKGQIETLDEMISSVNNDIRALLLRIVYDSISEKDETINNIFDAVSKIFDKKETIDKKVNSYYFDSFIIPSMVHENIKCQGSSLKNLQDYSKAMDCLTETDFDSMVDWSLNNYKCFSVISASKYSKPNYPLKFPTSIGKESTMRSFKAKLTEIKISRMYFPYFIKMVVGSINSNNYENAKQLLNKHNINKDDFYILTKYYLYPDELSIDTKTKSAFTRYLNKSANKEIIKKPTSNVKKLSIE